MQYIAIIINLSITFTTEMILEEQKTMENSPRRYWSLFRRTGDATKSL